jgi:dolichol kinase
MKPMKQRVSPPPAAREDGSSAPPTSPHRSAWAERAGQFHPDPETLRSWRQGVEWDRKGIHLTSTILAFWTFYADEPVATAGLVVATLFVLAVDRARLGLRRWGVWMYRTFPFVFRGDERHDYSGASVMMIGATLTSALFPAGPATAGILCLTWGDSAAALVGQTWSQWRRLRRLRRGKPPQEVAVRRRRSKTVAGTLGCLVVSMVMIVLVIGPRPAIVAPGALMAALMERWTPGRWDNLTMPLATAGIIHYLLTWLA